MAYKRIRDYGLIGDSHSAALVGTDGGEDEKYTFLDALQPYQYEYLDPDLPGGGPGKFVGIMAQDAQKSDLGATMVLDTDHGLMLDMRRGFSISLASLATLHKRVKALETT